MEKRWNGRGGRWDLARAARRRSVWRAVGILALGVLTVACVSAGAWYSRVGPTEIAPGDMIAVILDKYSGEYSLAQETDVVKCIRNAIFETDSTVRVVPPEKFRPIAFPQLTPAQLPAGEQQWIDLAMEAAFRDRIAPLGIRYLIVVEGGTRQDLKLMGAGVPGGAVVLEGERYSSYSATVVDLKQPADVGGVRARASGKSFIAILPLIPIIPPTESRACNDLGEQVAKFLVGENPPAETGGEQSGGTSAEP